MKNISRLLSFFVTASIVGILLITYLTPNTISNEKLSQFKTFDKSVLVTQNPELYEVYLEGEKVGYMAFGQTYGYQSDILVGVVVDDFGKIIETRVIEQHETPSFINKIFNAKFSEKQFLGEKIEKGFIFNENVIPVSGATISSRAITKGVEEGAEAIGKHFLDISIKKVTDVSFGVMEVALIIMMILTLVAFKTKNKHLRYLSMAYSILILGFKYKQFIAYSWIVSLLLGNFPNLSENIGWYILMFGTIALIASTGKNLYCNYICPFGALQEVEKRMSGFDFFKINPVLNKYLRVLPSVIAYITFVVVVLTGNMGGLSFEPFSLIYGRSGTSVQWALLPLILIMSLFVMRFYCNYACPVGVAMNLMVKIRGIIVSGVKRKEKASEKVTNMNKLNITDFKWQDWLLCVAVVALVSISIMTGYGNL